jgi:hypothetical protein
MTEGIEAVFLETHNWGKSVRFFQGLGQAQGARRRRPVRGDAFRHQDDHGTRPRRTGLGPSGTAFRRAPGTGLSRARGS